MRFQIKLKLVLPFSSLVICMRVGFLRSLSSCVQQGSLLPTKPFRSACMLKIQSCNKQHHIAFGLAMTLVPFPQVGQTITFSQNAF